MATSVSGIAAFVGAGLMFYLSWSILDFILLHSIRPKHPLRSYKRSSEDCTWALVTGAAAGIGFGVAKALAENGFGVILLGHREATLKRARSDLAANCPGAHIRVVVMDARTATADEMRDMVDSIMELNISILVNNVGGNFIASPYMRDLSTFSILEVDEVLNLNARFMARLTKLMLPLLSRAPNLSGERSLILNMSSGAFVGVPWLSVYSATKAFNRSLSHALARELALSEKTQHVDCLNLIPGDVRSQGNTYALPPGSPVALDYGEWTVSKIDGAVARGFRDLTPYWKHDLQIRALPFLRDGILTRALTQSMMAKKRGWEQESTKED